MASSVGVMSADEPIERGLLVDIVVDDTYVVRKSMWKPYVLRNWVFD